MGKSIQLKTKDNEKVYPHGYFPVGFIYLSVVNENPSKYFDGTWELLCPGRTLVCVDTSQTEFNVVKKTGGSKTHKHTTGDWALTLNQIPEHSHTGIFSVNNGVERKGGYGTSSEHTGVISEMGGTAWTSYYTGTTGGGQAHNHGDTSQTSALQPYMTCYMWVRTK